MLKRYDNYSSSSVEWIGDIPQHWVLKRIKHTTYVKGRIGWQGLRSDEFLEAGDSYVVTGTDFAFGKVVWETCYQIAQARYNEDPYIQLRENDLLITKDGTIGKIALVKNIPGTATLNSGIFVIRPNTSDYTTEFMYWVLQSDVFTSFINHNKSGSTILHLYQNVFNEFKFACPLNNEQTKIVLYLDHKTAQIDKLISDKEKLIELLNEERTSIINHAVTKGLNPDVPMKDSGIGWLGKVPEHWEVLSFRFCITLLTDFTANGSFASLAENVTYLDKGYSRLIRLTDLRTGLSNDGVYVDEQAHNFLRKSQLKGGELLIANVGAYAGLVCKMPPIETKATLGPNMFLLHLNQDTDYFNFQLNAEFCSKQLKMMSVSSAQPKLNKENVRQLKVIKPPLDEQIFIVSYINEEESRISLIVAKVQQEIQLLKEYKTALISEVVTGKVDVQNEVFVESKASL